MSINESISEFLEHRTDGAIVYNGFEDAFVGCVQRCSSPGVAVYSYEKMIDVLVRRDGLSYDEAAEFIDFNVLGGWVGDQTPYVLFDFGS